MPQKNGKWSGSQGGRTARAVGAGVICYALDRGNGSYTLTLSNLPLHSGVSVSMNANAINTDPAPDVDTVQLSAAGRTVSSTTDFRPDPPRPPIALAIESAVHTGPTLTVTIGGSGFEDGTFPSGSDGWELCGLEVTLLAPPRVSIEGAGTVEEDGKMARRGSSCVAAGRRPRWCRS